MGETSPESYWVPGHVRSYLRAMGFRLPLEDMEGHIAEWDRWMRAVGEFYDYRDTDGFVCFVNLSFHKTASVRFTRQREDSSRTSVALAPILSSPTTPRA